MFFIKIWGERPYSPPKSWRGGASFDNTTEHPTWGISTTTKSAVSFKCKFYRKWCQCCSGCPQWVRHSDQQCPTAHLHSYLHEDHQRPAMYHFAKKIMKQWKAKRLSAAYVPPWHPFTWTTFLCIFPVFFNRVNMGGVDLWNIFNI